MIAWAQELQKLSQKEATVLFYGNAMVERLLEHGEMEARVHLAMPEKKLHFRSLAWTGDEVANRLRAEGYAAHMKDLLAAWPAQVVVLGYGLNESFAGAAGLSAFRMSLSGHLDQLARLHPGARFVLLSPIATECEALSEKMAQPKPCSCCGNGAARRADVKLYADAIAGIAKTRGATFVDLFTPTSQSAVSCTTNGVHLQ